MARLHRLAACLLLVVMTGQLLTGCATRGTSGETPVSPAGRRLAIEAVTTWEARGRIALKAPGSSGQGNFSWTQTGDRTVLRVAGPFGTEAREIRWEPTRLTVRTGKGEVSADYAGPDAAERFLEQQLGWSMPVANVRHWLLGLAGPDSPAVETLDGSGLPASLTQDGWEIRYDEFRPEGNVALPRKLVLESSAGRIRLVIDQWQF